MIGLGLVLALVVVLVLRLRRRRSRQRPAGVPLALVVTAETLPARHPRTPRRGVRGSL